MKWFGRKAAVEAPRPFLLRGFLGAGAGEVWPRSYEAGVREAYLLNPVAQRAVKLVAEGVGAVSVFEVGGEARPSSAAARPTPPPPAAGGRSPSPFRGGSLTPALLETVAAHLLLHGNAFVQVVDGANLFALRPERVAVEAGADGWPVAYVYKAGARASRIGAVDALGRPGLVHVRSFHPLDDHLGLGCLGAAAGAVAIHNAATRWNKALLDNAARPSGAMVYAPADGAAMSAEQYRRLKEELEAAFQGAANAGRPMLLEGGLDWKAMSLTPAEMDFAGLKAAAARDIALAFGVPPMLIGLPGDSTYANYREANRALWRLTILPMAEKIVGALSDALAAWGAPRLAIDVDQVGALAEERERLWRQVSAADFLSEDEKREMLGFGARKLSGAVVPHPTSPRQQAAKASYPSPRTGEGKGGAA